MTPEQQMELFSLAYIRAVAAQAGYQVTRDETDTGLDGMLIGDAGSRPVIAFQAKSTSRDIRTGDHLRFPLPLNSYEILRTQSPFMPRILIVVLVPRERGQWLHQSENELCLRHCAYWLSLAGAPAVPNTTSVTVRIPMTNMFNSDQLSSLMRNAEEATL